MPLQPAAPTPPLASTAAVPRSPLVGGGGGGSGSSSSFLSHSPRSPRAQLAAPPPPSTPTRSLLATTAALTKPSPDPFLLPSQVRSPTLAPLRLHLCPSAAMLRALASAAKASSGFLSASEFLEAVCGWDCATTSAALGSGSAGVHQFLNTLFSLVAREASASSRGWQAGHATVDFRLLAIALLPALPLSPAPQRLELLWSLFAVKQGSLPPKQLISGVCSLGVGRVALHTDDPAAQDCWRTRGSIEAHARALVGAAFEDTRVGGKMDFPTFEAWLKRRQLALL